ncbi:winged helix-turn-helix domain-containing protein [Kitasatospora sp. NPDC047058]|uniref:ArsR/SmtB family transcription factor n=1 Tax=Kitasatospora sp. NPDC047058 TaxID=3155620 RepID=UPI0033CA3593
MTTDKTPPTGPALPLHAAGATEPDGPARPEGAEGPEGAAEPWGAAAGPASPAEGPRPRPLETPPNRPLPLHPVRLALLDLIAEWGKITSNQAAQHLHQSSGTCSFHLRQLARYGLIEEAPTVDGRSRPWRLRWEGTLPAGAGTTGPVAAPAALTASPAVTPPAPSRRLANGLAGDLAEDLEDTSYRQWLALRRQAPAEWQRDEASSDVLHLTPEELADLGAAVRALLAPYRRRGPGPGTRPVAAVTRLFPLLDHPAADDRQP